MTGTDWSRRAAALRVETRALIDGAFVSSASRTYLSINPATECVLYEAPSGDNQDVQRAVACARRAFEDGRWSRATPQVRRTVLETLARLCVRDRDELALLDSLTMGKPITQALADVDAACAYIGYAAAACETLTDGILPTDPRILALNVREPVGVVGAIVPWNFPTLNAALKIAPALAVGNSVVLKPSEISPLSALRLGALAQEAGIPDGVLNVVPGLGETVGASIALHDDVDLVTFTGSSVTGAQLLRASAVSNMKKLLLECGGKSPNIVFADAIDLDAAADDVVEHIVWNQGQVCVAGSRLLVEHNIHADLVARIAVRLRAVAAGDPLDPATTFGPLASRLQYDKVSAYVDDGSKRGLERIVGADPARRPGYYVMPTAFNAVDPSDRLAQDEIFGPVLVITPFKDLDDAARLAAATPYGLSARIWTRDLAKGYLLARRLRAGDITINVARSSGVSAGCGLTVEPFGRSGFGAESGIEGMRAYTRAKGIQANMPAWKGLT